MLWGPEERDGSNKDSMLVVTGELQLSKGFSSSSKVCVGRKGKSVQTESRLWLPEAENKD